jgi:putative ABC transport system permease protein
MTNDHIPSIQQSTIAHRFWRFLSESGKDLRYGLRVLLRKPVFTICIVVTLGLAVGLTTGLFAVVNGALLRPLPYPEPDRIVHVSWLSPQGGDSSITQKQFQYLNENTKSLTASGMYSYTSIFNLWNGSYSTPLRGLPVSAGLFQALGVSPFLGREFLPEEDRVGAPRTVMLGYGVWQRHFGSDPSLIGRNIELNGRPYTVAGIMPNGFSMSPDADMWISVFLHHPNDSDPNFEMLGRLDASMSLEQAQVEVSSLAESFNREFPDLAGTDFRGARLVAYQKWLFGDNGPRLFLLLGAAALILLIAATNVANLLLSRAVSREKEIGVRLALGANRFQLLRLLSVESLILAVLGGALGLAIAPWLIKSLSAVAPKESDLATLASRYELDWRVFTFALALSLLIGISVGLVSSLRSLKGDVATALKVSEGAIIGMGRRKMRTALMFVEVAICAILLTGTFLLVRSLIGLRSVDLGFNPGGVWTVRMSLPPEKYRTAAQTWAFENAVQEQLKNLPGVTSVACASSVPPERGMRTTFEIKGQKQEVYYWGVSPEYFETLNIPVMQGRTFREEDRPGAPPVAIITDALAQRVWQSEDPVGDQAWCAVKNNKCPQIVGVVRNIKINGLRESNLPVMFLPQAQLADGTMRYMNRAFLTAFFIKSSAPVSMDAVREAVNRVDPAQPIVSLDPMSQAVSDSIASEQLYTALLSVFAGMAILLAAIGIYGVVAYSVAERTREIGLRVALGAEPRDIRRLVIGESMRVTLTAIALGLFCAFWLARFLRSLLYGVNEFDLISLVTVTVFMSLVALIASYVPALRASNMDPSKALRHQ